MLVRFGMAEVDVSEGRVVVAHRSTEKAADTCAWRGTDLRALMPSLAPGQQPAASSQQLGNGGSVCSLRQRESEPRHGTLSCYTYPPVCREQHYFCAHVRRPPPCGWRLLPLQKRAGIAPVLQMTRRFGSWLLHCSPACWT